MFNPWHRKASPGSDRPSNLYSESALLESDPEDTSFPLFRKLPPKSDMANGSNPISINIQRQNSTSPRQQTSNLTSALQSTNGNEVRSAAMLVGGGASGKSAMPSGRKDSISMGGLTPQFGSSALPISGGGRSQGRRESGAGSLMNGMSWGGVSMNSWIRDE